MIKPLLKVIPALSGNLKLACTLTDYQQIDADTFKATSKSARIYPLSSNSFQNLIDINLYTSSWEYDVCKYYKVYSDIFYKDTFTFDKNNLLYCNDLSSVINDRNSEFEFGCKRVSYKKTGKQLAFFAPIYCDTVNDLPDSFEIELKIYNNDKHNIIKKIIVDLTETKNNYLYIYLKRYLAKVDDNVIFIQPKSKQATYYGIDIRTGGFNKYVDNIISKIFSEETTINGFDALISGGFKRNGLIMKQIIPLAFYFSANDILTDFEQIKYKNAYIDIKGIYIKNNHNIPFYMIDDNYNNLSLKTLSMNNLTGKLEYKYNYENILDFNDNISISVTDVEEYKYSNKLNKTYNRWMLKYSDIDTPYITNNNYIFSKNQLLNNLYYEYPQNYYPISLFCELTSSNESNIINLLLPLADNIANGAPYYNYIDIIDKYNMSINNYINNWFDITEYNNIDSIINNTDWKDIHNKDNKIFYKGILYDFNNIYKSFNLDKTINKFAILLYINDKTFTQQNIYDYIYVNSSLSYINAYSNLENNIASNLYIPTFNSYTYSYTNNVNSVQLYNNIYTYANTEIDNNYIYENNKYFTYNTLGTGKYVDINDLGLDFYEINKYYSITDIKIDDVVKLEKLQKFTIEGYELLPIHYLSNLSELAKNNIINNIYYSTSNTIVKYKLNELLDKIDINDSTTFEKYLFYIKRTFISKFDYDNNFSKEPFINEEIQYIYYPKFISNSNKEIANIFIKIDKRNCFYGNNVPLEYINRDNDVLYIDPYKVKDILTNVYTLSGSLYISNINNISSSTSTIYSYNLGDMKKNNYVRIRSTHNNINKLLNELEYTNTYSYNSDYGYDVSKIITKIQGLTYIADFTWNDWMGYYSKYNYIDNIIFRIRNNNQINYYKYNSNLSNISNIELQDNILDDIININMCAYVSKIDKTKSYLHINTYTTNEFNNSYFNNSYEYILHCDTNDNLYKYAYACNAVSYVIDKYIDNTNGIGTFFTGEKSNFTNNYYPQKIITAIKGLQYNKDLYDFSKSTFDIYVSDTIEFVIESSNNNDKLKNPITYITLNNDLVINDFNVTQGDYLYNTAEKIVSNEFYAKLKNKESVLIFKKYIMNDLIDISEKTDTSVLNHLYVKNYYINNDGLIAVNYILLKDKYTFDKISFYDTGIDYIIGVNFSDSTNEEESIETELYYKKSFIKLTKPIYTNIIALDDVYSKYSDLYVYRLEKSEDILSQIKYSYISYTTQELAYLAYYSKLYYIDSSSLMPLFNSILEEDKYNTVIYKNRILNKINPVVFYNDTYTYTLYRNNDYNKLMLYDVTGIKTNKYNGDITYIQPGTYSFIYDTYKEILTYDTNTISNSDISYTVTDLNKVEITYTYVASKIKTFDINNKNITNFVNINSNTNSIYNDIYNKYHINIYEHNDNVYGFYLINVNLTNTNNVFNLIEYYNGKATFEPIKYFTHINGNNIIDNHNVLTKMFKNIIPAMNINILNMLYNIPLLSVQHKSLFQKKYKNTIINDKKHIVMLTNEYKNQITLYRYFDNIIPYIIESPNIYTEYFLKVKTLQNVLYNDDIMYNETINIYNYPGIRIYKNETDYDIVKQLEYKYYNDNRFINLETEFYIHISDNLTVNKLIEYQNNDIILTYFTNYINKLRNTKFNDIEILFLFKKYNILLLSYHNKLSSNFNEKLYSLTYKFILK